MAFMRNLTWVRLFCNWPYWLIFYLFFLSCVWFTKKNRIIRVSHRESFYIGHTVGIWKRNSSFKSFVMRYLFLIHLKKIPFIPLRVICSGIEVHWSCWCFWFTGKYRSQESFVHSVIKTRKTDTARLSVLQYWSTVPYLSTSIRQVSLVPFLSSAIDILKDFPC